MKTQIVLLDAEEAKVLLATIIQQEVAKSLENYSTSPLSEVWLTRQEMKRLTGWSDRTLQNLRDSGQLAFSQHGRKILYPRAAVIAFLEGNLVNGKSQSTLNSVRGGWKK